MKQIYKVSMSGMALSDPYVFLKAVFPQWDGEEACSDTTAVWVAFDSPQTPANLGPFVKVEQVESLFS